MVASLKTSGVGLENRRRRSSGWALPVGSMEERARTVSGGEERGGREVGERWRVKEEVDRGGRMEKGVGKEREDGLVVERETATDMVCMRLVRRKVEVHFWFGVKVRVSSFTSGFTSLSMGRERERRGVVIELNKLMKIELRNRCGGY